MTSAACATAKTVSTIQVQRAAPFASRMKPIGQDRTPAKNAENHPAQKLGAAHKLGRIGARFSARWRRHSAHRNARFVRGPDRTRSGYCGFLIPGFLGVNDEQWCDRRLLAAIGAKAKPPKPPDHYPKGIKVVYRGRSSTAALANFAALPRAKALNCRRIVGVGNPGPFAWTTWWRTQSCETGLRGLHSLITGRNAGRGVARAALWRPMRYRKRVFSMDFRHGSLLKVTGSRTGGRRECVRPEQRASGEGSVSWACA
jgi:hypothetical protein